MVDLFDPRKIGIAGGLLSSLSLLACAFVNDIKIYFLTYGFMLALGQALLLAATFAILPHYFNKRLSLANGIMNFFAAALVVVFPIILSAFLNNYGLKEAFYFLAASNFLAAVLSLMFKPMLPKSTEMKLIPRIKESFGLEVLKNKNFLIWCVASFIGMLGYLIPVINIVRNQFYIKLIEYEVIKSLLSIGSSFN